MIGGCIIASMLLALYVKKRLFGRLALLRRTRSAHLNTCAVRDCDDHGESGRICAAFLCCC